MMNFALKMMDFVFKMMNFVQQRSIAAPPTASSARASHRSAPNAPSTMRHRRPRGCDFPFSHFSLIFTGFLLIFHSFSAKTPSNFQGAIWARGVELLDASTLAAMLDR